MDEVISSIDYGDALYCDTDSLIYTGDKMPKVKLSDDLGDWGVEQECCD